MKLTLALAVAKQMLNDKHPSTIKSREVAPNLRMIQVNNGQYITSQSFERAKDVWTFEAFVKEFDNCYTREN
jgi:hypothetical protein